MEKQRLPGFYWVKRGETWEICEWIEDHWESMGSIIEYNDNIFEEIDENRIERRRYIGLTDRNGKNIYEGDILADGAIVEWFDSLTWDSGGSLHPGFYCKKWMDYDELSYHDSFRDVEVVGSIYENITQ